MKLVSLKNTKRSLKMNKLIKFLTAVIVVSLVFHACDPTSKTTKTTYKDPFEGKTDADLTPTELYIKKYREIAIEEMKRAKVPASIKLAQAILESGNGSSFLATKGNNHFGIKCGSKWTGETIYFDDDRENECFRKYSDPSESFRNHSDFLTGSTRYEDLFLLDITDYKGWARGLKQAGYATRRNYAELLIGIIDKYQLFIYDDPAFLAEGELVGGGEEDQFEYNGVMAVMVKPNESFSDIARNNKLTVDDLLKFNDLEQTPSKLKVGTIFYIETKKKKAKETYHIVKEGETMHKISQDYGVQLELLLERNMMNRDEYPAIGEIIYLKGKRKEPPVLIPDIDLKEKMADEKTLYSDDDNKSERKGDLESPSDQDKNDEVEDKKVVAEEDKKVNEDEKGIEEIKEEMAKKEEQQNKPQQPGAKLHRVEKGETLFSIATKYGVSVDDLKKWNNKTDNSLALDEKLIVEDPEQYRKPDETPIVKNDEKKENNFKQDPKQQNPEYDTLFHVVKDGEDLYSISRQYEMTIIDIVALNEIQKYDLKPGTKLVIKLPEKTPPPGYGTSGDDPGSGNQQKHTVQKGETLYSISRKYGVTVEQIKRWNNMTSNSLNVGEVIIVSDKPAAKKNTNTQSNDGVYHTVQPKETLYSISKLYNTTVDKIKQLNNMTDNSLSIGQKLRVK
jgi:LysM repeat protein